MFWVFVWVFVGARRLPTPDSEKAPAVAAPLTSLRLLVHSTFTSQ